MPDTGTRSAHGYLAPLAERSVLRNVWNAAIPSGPRAASDAPVAGVRAADLPGQQPVCRRTDLPERDLRPRLSSRGRRAELPRLTFVHQRFAVSRGNLPERMLCRARLRDRQRLSAKSDMHRWSLPVERGRWWLFKRGRLPFRGGLHGRDMRHGRVHDERRLPLRRHLSEWLLCACRMRFEFGLRHRADLRRGRLHRLYDQRRLPNGTELRRRGVRNDRWGKLQRVHDQRELQCHAGDPSL